MAFFSRLLSAVAALGLFLTVTPVQAQAQYAYNYAGAPKHAASRLDPEEKNRKVTHKVVHGVVQDEKGVLPGATVWLHGTRTIAVTNSEGEFELRVPADATVVKLVCSYGGLQEEVVTMAPVQALGSLYLVRSKTPDSSQLAAK